MVRHFLLVAALSFIAWSADAQGPKPPGSLPTLDWQCYASFTVTFAPPGSSHQGLGVDGDNLKKPRIELHVLHNQILKVVENPSIPEIRKEYAVQLYQISADFIRANPVYAWREDTGSEVKLYAFNINDKILSRTRVTASPRGSNDSQVLLCR